MKRIKEVNIVFMMSALVPIIIVNLFDILGIQIKDSLVSIIVSVLVYALPTIVYLMIRGGDIKGVLRLKKIRISNVFLLILFAFLISPAMSLINAISLLFSTNMIQSTVTDITDHYPLIVGVIAVGVLPAIFEESVYRGVLYNEYRKVNPRVAIVLSALLFGLLHMNLNQFTYAFAMGIIFALIIEATDSILSTMILHFVINSTSVVVSYCIPKLLRMMEKLYGTDLFNAEQLIDQMMGTPDKVELVQSIQAYILPAIISGVLAFVVFRVIAKNEGRYDEVKNIFKPSGEQARFTSMISIPLIVGIGVCIAFIIANLIVV